jgi:hypothetical protein
MIVFRKLTPTTTLLLLLLYYLLTTTYYTYYYILLQLLQLLHTTTTTTYYYILLNHYLHTRAQALLPKPTARTPRRRIDRNICLCTCRNGVAYQCKVRFACAECKEHKRTSQEHLHYLSSNAKEQTNERHKSACTTYSKKSSHVTYCQLVGAPRLRFRASAKPSKTVVCMSAGVLFDI